MSRKNPVPDVVVDQMVVLLQELKYVPAVAEKLSLPVKTVHYWLKKKGLLCLEKKYYNSACLRNKEKVLSMFEEGHSLSHIGRTVGTTQTRVGEFLRRNGVTKKFEKVLKGEQHYNWKGGRLVDKDGYVMIYCPKHPNSRKHTPYILEHRLVMEKMIGRFLLAKEVVHHKNGVKDDNRPENLQLFSENSVHLAFELTGHVPNWTPEGLARMKKGIAHSAVVRRERIQNQSKHDALQLP